MADIIKELDDIKQDVKNIAGEISQKLAKQAENDMIAAHEQIVGQYYGGHNPSTYHRHKKSPAIKKTLISHLTRKSRGENSYYARVKIGSTDMPDHTRKGYSGVNQDNVFDLVWNQGVRGLPEEGSAPLTKSYTWLNHSFNVGDIWINPYWGEKYHNVFSPIIEMDGYSTRNPGTPDKVFQEFVDSWWDDIGSNRCDDIMSAFK